MNHSKCTLSNGDTNVKHKTTYIKGLKLLCECDAAKHRYLSRKVMQQKIDIKVGNHTRNNTRRDEELH